MAKSPLTPKQQQFASRFIGDTGLDGGVVTAWLLAEESGSAAQARDSANNNDWLNIGYTDSGTFGSGNSIWSDPLAAADASANWLKGQNSIPGYGRASVGIQAILNTVGKSAQAQISAIQGSGWASSGYPSLPTLYSQYKGNAPVGTLTPFSASGTAGAGVFTVGETTNPNESYFAAINRMASEVNWYLYTRLDAPQNVIFLADGTALLAQKPVATIDRFRDRDKILYWNFTWDNTALEYKSKHKKKSRAQSKSAVQSVTSPTEATLHLICNIAGENTFNPGDVMRLTNFGPGNGPWLIAEIRRSVFQPYSEITLVPGISPITSNQLGDSQTHDTTDNLGVTGTSMVGATGPGSGGAPASVGGYVNPLAQIQGLKASRIDMGVDYSGTGPLLAVGDGTIGNVYNSGWPGGAYITLTLSSGSYAGKIVYYAENITPAVSVGQKVKAGDTVGTLHDAYPNMEIGWSADTVGTALAAAHNQIPPSGDAGGWSSAAGASFSRFLQSLGAPAGVMQSGGPHGQNPPGYP